MDRSTPSVPFANILSEVLVTSEKVICPFAKAGAVLATTGMAVILATVQIKLPVDIPLVPILAYSTLAHRKE